MEAKVEVVDAKPEIKKACKLLYDRKGAPYHQ